jgi:transcriptional regulator with XRE-family HTH domain
MCLVIFMAGQLPFDVRGVSVSSPDNQYLDIEAGGVNDFFRGSAEKVAFVVWLAYMGFVARHFARSRAVFWAHGDRKYAHMSRKPRRLMPPTGGPTMGYRHDMEVFARKLHDVLTANNMSQSDLAREVWGTTRDGRGFEVAKGRDRISAYVNAKAFPEPGTLRMLAKALNMKPEELAPEAVASAVDRENPAVSITAVAGHFDKVYLRVNQLVPLAVALEVGRLLEAANAGTRASGTP